MIQDIIDLFRNPKEVKDSYSMGFIWIALVILVGQILIVTYAGGLFNVSSLELEDWCWILLFTSPVLIVADIFRFIGNIINKGDNLKTSNKK